MAKRKRPSAQQQIRRRPYAFGVEGFGMLMLALLFDGVNIVLGILDFVVVGIVIGPIWNFIAAWTVGLWLALQTVSDVRGLRQLKTAGKRAQRHRRVALKLITKRIIIPFVGNSVPIAKFFPFWVWQVWGALDKDPFPRPEQQEEPEEPQEAQARARQIAAAGARS